MNHIHTTIVAVLLAVSLQALAWDVSTNTDPMTDNRFVLAISPTITSKTAATHSPRAALRVSCSDHRGVENHGQALQVSLWASYLNLDSENGRFRIDDGQPVDGFVWASPGTRVAGLALSEKSKRLSNTSPRDVPASEWSLVSRLLNANRLLVEIPQYGSNPVFEFPIGDAGHAAIRRVMDTCQIDYATGRTQGWRVGTHTLPSEQVVKEPVFQQAIGYTGAREPALNMRTGLVIVPTVFDGDIVEVKVNGVGIELTSRIATGTFTVPVSPALAEHVEIEYVTKTDAERHYGYGQYDRIHRVTFDATPSDQSVASAN